MRQLKPTIAILSLLGASFQITSDIEEAYEYLSQSYYHTAQPEQDRINQLSRKVKELTSIVKKLQSSN
tara:strand:+ start:90 stop:293 length:204 start_codon:yes stop_codon:yes gene_type:complete